MTRRKAVDVHVENVALRAELARVYRALADANARIRSVGSVVPAHPFGEYLLSKDAA